MQECGYAQVDCQTCVEDFAAKGGCAAMLAGEDVDHLVPTGCDPCGQQAAQHCLGGTGSAQACNQDCGGHPCAYCDDTGCCTSDSTGQ
jgi:hypothetical protein